MACTLPTEIIELIVGEAFRSPGGTPTLAALSVVNSAFTAPCQQYLWRSVTLRSFLAISSVLHHQSQTLARDIICSPRIAAQVTRFTCHIVSGRNAPHHGYLAGAMRAMPNIVEFTLKFGKKRSGRTMNFESGGGARHNVILDVLASEKLRRLTLRRISGIPVLPLRGALAHLESLDLYLCSFTLGGTQSAGHPAPMIEANSLALRKLTSDLSSFKNLHRALHLSDATCGFPDMTTLDLTIDGPVRSGPGVLRHAVRLQELRVHVLKPKNLESRAVHNLVQQLNPASHKTLARLWVSIHSPDVVPLVSDPFMGLCLDESLPRLVALRRFELDIHLRSPLGVRTLSSPVVDGCLRRFGWDQLDEALSGLTDLEQVRVRVYVKCAVGFQWALKQRNRVTEKRFEERMVKGVYPVHFPALCQMKDAGNLKFEFTVKVRIGS